MNLKERLRKKLKKNGGFTLIEMLIVVAIIAILVVVSIPMVSNNLENARNSTDQANERAAKAAALAEYMLDNKTGSVNYVYDATSGAAIEGTTFSGTGYGQCSKHKGGYIAMTVDANGAVAIEWKNLPTSGGDKDPHGSAGFTTADE